MTDTYTPTTEEIREYVETGGEPRPWVVLDEDEEAREKARGEAFDRWLAVHDAEVRASVLAEQGEPEWEYGLADEGAYIPSDGERALRDLLIDAIRRYVVDQRVPYEHEIDRLIMVAHASDDYEAGYAEGFHHGRSTPRDSQGDQDEPSNCESDERVQAWEQIAKHPIFRRCYDDERPLIVSMLARLDVLKDLEETVNELAPAPRIEYGEPEWEYGYASLYDHNANRHTLRRRKAGPWIPVEENTEALTDGSEPQHDASCAEWCNHCAVCGVGILYGSRCSEHPNRTEPEWRIR